MGTYVGAVWRCRYFWLSLVKMDLRSRYRRSVLGLGWSLMHPILMTIVFCTMFATIFRVKIEEFAPYVLAGLACWNFLLVCTTQGCHCFFLGESYIRQYPSPLAIYPLRTALSSAVHFLIALVVVLGLVWYLKGFANLAFLPVLIPNLLLIFVFGWSLAVLTGFANVYFQDTQHICEVGFQILFYATPIMYPPGMLQGTALESVLRLNPFISILALVRSPVVDGQFPAMDVFAVAGFTVVVTTLTAALMLTRLQRRLIFHL